MRQETLLEYEKFQQIFTTSHLDEENVKKQADNVGLNTVVMMEARCAGL